VTARGRITGWPRGRFFVDDWLSRLARRQFGAEITLIVPVAPTHPTVDEISREYRHASPADLPLHVTLLYPFVPAERIDEHIDVELRQLFSSVPVFQYRLDRIARFAQALYLAPNPPDPFIGITRKIVDRWPAYRPYAGEFSEIVPHVTIATRTVPMAMIDALSAALPLEMQANRAQLLRLAPGGAWSILRSYAFGT
jgi:2'-5' RNA ligase